MSRKNYFSSDWLSRRLPFAEDGNIEVRRKRCQHVQSKKVNFLVPHIDLLETDRSESTTDSDGENHQDESDVSETTNEQNIVHHRLIPDSSNIVPLQLKTSDECLEDCGAVDLISLLDKLEHSKTSGFLYLASEFPPDHENYSPFALKFVQVEKDHECLIFNEDGVLRKSGSSISYQCSIKEWKKRLSDWYSLTNLRTFKYYSMFKYLVFWHRQVKRKKFVNWKRNFKNAFIHSRIELRNALGSANEICMFLADLSLFAALTKDDLESFEDLNNFRINDTVRLMIEGRERIKSAFIEAMCVAVVRSDLVKDVFMNSNGSFDNGNPEPSIRMSYHEYWTREKEHRRISGTLRIVDCMVQNALVSILKNSLDSFMRFTREIAKLGFDAPECWISNLPKLPSSTDVFTYIQAECDNMNSGIPNLESYCGIISVWETSKSKLKPLSSDSFFKSVMSTPQLCK